MPKFLQKNVKTFFFCKLIRNKVKTIDFVAINKSETKYIQVCETLNDKTTLERELSAFKFTTDYYEIIITIDKTYVTNINGIKIINIIDFLLS